MCCCFWLVALCRPSAPNGPGGFWNWWLVSVETGTPIHTPSVLSGHQGVPSSERTAWNKVKRALLSLTPTGSHIVLGFFFPGLENKPHPCDSWRTRLVSPATATLALPGTHTRTPAAAHELGGRQAHGAGQEMLAAWTSLRHLDHLKSHGLKGSQH